MFRGKIFLTNIKASDLPWTKVNRTDQGSELRPYLVISVDGVERKRVRCEERPEVCRCVATLTELHIYRTRLSPPVRTGVLSSYK